MKARYLSFFSYIGTGFRSSEKIWVKKGREFPDTDSVEGMLEIGLRKLKPLNYPHLTLSSRTDGGVHALNASAHFDLECYGSGIFNPSVITYELNKFFNHVNTGISVKKVLRVPDDFHARFHAKQRTYLYRLAVLKPRTEHSEETGIGSLIPIEEYKRCHFIRNCGFDIERLKEGAKYFIGYHDFTTFKKFDKVKQYKHNRRELLAIDVRPGRPNLSGYSGSTESNFDYWNIEITGRAFVHNQIRRMLGTLVSVANGKLEPKDIKLMLQIPSKHSWHNFIQTGPPFGLYLCDVQYDPADLIYEPDSAIKTAETVEDSLDSVSDIVSLGNTV